jgi:cell wall-associated NlpC family hydrolase
MTFMKKNRLGKSFVAICLSLSVLGTGSLMLDSQSAKAATVSSVSKADTVVNTAMWYRGKVTYRFGVRDPQHLRFDCSSFVQFIYKQAGISLPWGTRSLAHVGTPVYSKSQLHKGDLILFSVHTPGKVNHVGIYIGNGKFIHNSTSSGVVVSDLYSGYWQNRFIVGRRVIG